MEEICIGKSDSASSLAGWAYRRSQSALSRFGCVLALVVLMALTAIAQPGPGGPPGGGQGPRNQNRAIVEQFDADEDQRLNAKERARAVEFIKANPQGRGGRRGPGGRGGRGGRGGERPPASPGVKLTPADVQNYPEAPLYDANVLRTFFIELENPAWEAELVAFNNTDVDVPAKVTVDGKEYADVGIHFRGNSSFGVGDGYKRSLNLSFDFVHEGQAIQGYRTLNFLNANGDPTFLRTVLSLHIARQYIPAPKANLVRVVINGENWGVYANQQQFNKDFLKDNYDTTKGSRWKIPQGGGNGVGAFRFVDDEVSSYQGAFQIKSKEKPKPWEALIGLAKILDKTPVAQLEAALAPVLDIDSHLYFLALDNTLVSGDGFWTRGADYSLYLHPDGRFRFILYDANEMFSFRGGRRRGGGGGYQGENGVKLDPLAGTFDESKPIVARILAVPALRERYLGFVREIAEKSLDWDSVGPIVKQYRDLVLEDVKRDTRKLFPTQQFVTGTANDPLEGNLRSFFDQRRAALLKMTAH